MLGSTETMPPATQTGLYFEPLAFDRSSLPVVSTGQRAFKKHKVLPHPRQKPSATQSTRPPHQRATETKVPQPNSASSTSTPPSQRHESRGSGGSDPPPTPPAHSRTTSSSSHSALTSSPTYIESRVKGAASVPARASATPPNQRSPPTPDGTPPEAGAWRLKAFRPSLADRIPSKATTVDSRTDSFKTARENPCSSDEDDKLTPKARPVILSGKDSQSTVRQPVDPKQQKAPGVGLGLGLRLETDGSLTPRTKQEFGSFDGKWGSESDREVEQEWDDNLNRNGTIRKRHAQPKMTSINGRNNEITMEDAIVDPTNATKALRSMPLQEQAPTHSVLTSTKESKAKCWTIPSTSDSSISTDVRRSPGISSKSTVSTVVEAILVDTPPQRQKTLRHVRKQTALRNSESDISPSSSAANSIGFEETIKRSTARGRFDGAQTDSVASSGTVNSLASRKARREVWKNKGIPVVVIPDRRASMKSTGTPSLRSTSSRRSQRSNSMSSVPLSTLPKTKDLTPLFDRPQRRGRALSESDGSLPGDQRTIDYPPVVPMRTSSLSAPTSRNGSLAGSLAGSRSASLTRESLKAHDNLQEQQTKLPPPQVTVERVPTVEYIPAEGTHSNQKRRQPAPSVGLHKDVHDHRSLVDHNGDPFFGKRLTTHNTPFSQASVETNGTHSAAEVSEALAVSLFPHQNKSVLVVDHTSSKSSDANAVQREQSVGTEQTEKAPVLDPPMVISSGPDSVPVTPPRPQFSMDDVDSPLRNPRAPPEPPVIKFIPATPSGLTPAQEKMKMLGSYFEETDKRPSLVKRAFSFRRASENNNQRPGFLLRTLSLSKNIRKDTAENPDLVKGKNAVLHRHPAADDAAPDEARLHPFWKPSHFDPELDEDCEDCVHNIPDEVDQVYRYPFIDDRPSLPVRSQSLSQRMKHTFAILPIANEEHYTISDNRSTERRIIKRTSSGNLRVMRQHDSYSSMRWDRPTSPSSHHRSKSHSDVEGGRPSTAPDRPGRRVWGLEKRVDAQGRRFFPGWQDKFEQYGIQNLQRRLSEHRRQKRTDVLRQKISGPREARDGVGEVIKRNSYKGPSYQASSGINGHSTMRHVHLRGIERAPNVQVQV